MVLRWGRLHPPGEHDADAEKTLYYTKSQLTDLAKDIVGKPLCIEHEERHPVGKVLFSWVDDGGCYALFSTDETTGGKFATELLNRGIYAELSLGHRAAVDPQTYVVGEKRATELSIVRTGARDGTHIYDASPAMLSEFVEAKDTLAAARKFAEDLSSGSQQTSTASAEDQSSGSQQTAAASAASAASHRQASAASAVNGDGGLKPALVKALLSAEAQMDANQAKRRALDDATRRLNNERAAVANELGLFESAPSDAPEPQTTSPNLNSDTIDRLPAVVQLLRSAEQQIVTNEANVAQLRQETASINGERLAFEIELASSALMNERTQF